MHTKKFDYIYKEKVMLTDRNFEKYLIYIFFKLTNSSVHCISSVVLFQDLALSNMSKFVTSVSLFAANENIKMIFHMKMAIS